MDRHRKRVEDQLRRVLSELITRRLRDPRVGMVTVSRVEMSPDLKYANAFLSILGAEQEVEATLDGVRHAAGFLRSEVGKTMRLRYTPEIRFHHDDTLDAQARIERILREEAPEASGETDERGHDRS